MSDDPNKPNAETSKVEELKPEASKGKDKENEKKPSPFGEDIEPVMYIILNKKLGDYGVIGAPGFLKDKWRAYGALVAAEKCLDDFYRKKETAQNKFMLGVAQFNQKMRFRNFFRGKR